MKNTWEKPPKLKHQEIDEEGAYAEKPVRDLAREDGVSEEEKAILDRLAERRGEKAMQEYAIEKEKSTTEKFLSRMDKIAKEIREKGLVEDAIIVEKTRDRFNRYVETLRNNKDKWEDQFGRRASFNDLRHGPSDLRVNYEIPITHKIGESGGLLYSPNGSAGSWFKNAEHFEENKESIENLKSKYGMEVINFGFSKQGMTEFCRSIGVLKENEEAIDLPAIYEKSTGQKINSQNFSAFFPTDIEGMNMYINREQRRSYDGQKEEKISLGFNEEFLEALLNNK